MLYLTMIKRVVWRIKDKQYTAGFSRHRMVMQYTHYECYDMLLTLDDCKICARTLARVYGLPNSGQRLPDANVFGRWEYRGADKSLARPD